MKTQWKILSVACAAMVSLSVLDTGCSSQASKTGSSANVPWNSKKTDTVVMSVVNNYYTAGEKQLAKQYMKLHPETKVVVDVVASNDAYNTKMKTTITTDKNTAPDIVHANFIPGALNASGATCITKGYLMDLKPLLTEKNAYNGNKTLAASFKSEDLARMGNGYGGYLAALPFDFCGVGFFYNKNIFKKYDMSVPTVYEDLLADCATLKQKGYKSPVNVTAEIGNFLSILGDAGYRKIETQFLALPGDAAYDASSMAANTKINDTDAQVNDPTSDLYGVFNQEKVCAYIKKNGIDTSINKSIWSEFAKLAQYFQDNWTNLDASKAMTNFENQSSPLLFSGSWNVGKVISDMSQLPASKKFDWGTFLIKSYKNPPDGFSSAMRSIYVFGNQMGIIPKTNEDHEKRVEDVLKYWYSPKVAQMMYDVTLSSGNLVQGPPAVQGVKLSAANTARLDGFITKGSVQGFGSMIGQNQYLSADEPIYNDLCNKLSTGKITVDQFLPQLNSIVQKVNDTTIQQNGFDLNPATKDTPAK